MDAISAWHLWIIAGLIAGALEVQLTNFVMLWFAVGAFAASLVAGLGGPLGLQLTAFLAVSIALFAASRTIFQRVPISNRPRSQSLRKPMSTPVS